MFIFDSFRLLWSFQERHVENVGLAGAQLPEVLLQIRIPSYPEWIVPSSKNRISGLDLEVGFSLITSKPRSRDVSNNVRKVRGQASNLQRELELLDSCRRRVVVLLGSPLDSREWLAEIRAPVMHSVSLLERHVSTPVADFDISLQARDMDKRLCELVADLDRLKGTSREFTE